MNNSQHSGDTILSIQQKQKSLNCFSTCIKMCGDNSTIQQSKAAGLKWEFGQNPTQKCRTEDAMQLNLQAAYIRMLGVQIPLPAPSKPLKK